MNNVKFLELKLEDLNKFSYTENEERISNIEERLANQNLLFLERKKKKTLIALKTKTQTKKNKTILKLLISKRVLEKLNLLKI